jgi:hypothetical protein
LLDNNKLGRSEYHSNEVTFKPFFAAMNHTPFPSPGLCYLKKNYYHKHDNSVIDVSSCLGYKLDRSETIFAILHSIYSLLMGPMDHHALKNINNCENTNISFYLATSGGLNSNLYLNVHFSTPVLITHMWQLKTAIFLHSCLICAVLLASVLVSCNPLLHV